MNTAPVVFFIFNRPELTARVFARIRDARPTDLLIVGDGPRPGRDGENRRVAAARRIVLDGIDWPCKLHANFSERNLGCRQRVASGLEWAFSCVSEAIVLEDDCLPDPSFFGFCTSMLARYRDDASVLHVNGTNLAPRRLPGGAAYRFSRHAWMWGWATWSRAWTHYDAEFSTWSSRQTAVRDSFASSWEAQYWLSSWNRIRSDPIRGDTWDFPWQFSVRAAGGRVLMPRHNLVQNLGFGADATHTIGDTLAHLENLSANAGLLIPPAADEIDPVAEERFTRAYAGVPPGLGAELKTRLRVWRARLARSGADPCAASRNIQ
jgi:hypothetical protein